MSLIDLWDAILVGTIITTGVKPQEKKLPELWLWALAVPEEKEWKGAENKRIHAAAMLLGKNHIPWISISGLRSARRAAEIIMWAQHQTLMHVLPRAPGEPLSMGIPIAVDSGLRPRERGEELAKAAERGFLAIQAAARTVWKTSNTHYSSRGPVVIADPGLIRAVIARIQGKPLVRGTIDDIPQEAGCIDSFVYYPYGEHLDVAQTNYLPISARGF